MAKYMNVAHLSTKKDGRITEKLLVIFTYIQYITKMAAQNLALGTKEIRSLYSLVTLIFCAQPRLQGKKGKALGTRLILRGHFFCSLLWLHGTSRSLQMDFLSFGRWMVFNIWQLIIRITCHTLQIVKRRFREFLNKFSAKEFTSKQFCPHECAIFVHSDLVRCEFHPFWSIRITNENL